MRNIRITCLFILSITIGPNLSVFAETYTETDTKSAPKVSVSAESDFASRYVWHGLAYSEDPTWQPSLTIDFFGFSASVWGNFVLGNEADQGQFNELDYELSYSIDWKKLTIEPGIVAYTYPSTINSPSTAELSLHLEYPVGPIAIFTDASVDVVEYDGATFLELGASFERELPLHFSIESSAIVGFGNSRFNNAYVGEGLGTSGHAFDLSLAFPWNPWKGLTLTPHGDLVILLDPDVRNAVQEPTIVWGGLKIGYEF